MRCRASADEERRKGRSRLTIDFFPAQRWGEFLISRLAPMQWTSESFSHLVIPDAYRRIVKALVTVHSGRLKDQLMIDVVAGKGNGLVMCFHGSPGTGKVSQEAARCACLYCSPIVGAEAPGILKTLTAEAIAEHLRRPLYVVSAGELGILPQVLENQLRDILAVSRSPWSENQRARILIVLLRAARRS